MEEEFGFSDDEIAVGIDYSYSKFGFVLDKRFLCQRADLALEKKKEFPDRSVPSIANMVLLDVGFQERQAYKAAIGKMFSARSSARRRRHH